MSEIMNKINALVGSKNQSERRLSRLIIDSELDVATLSAVKLGLLAGVSDASVIRFAKSLGFSGFTEFKMMLFSHQKMPPKSGLYQDLTQYDSTQQLIDKSKVLFTNRIESSLGLINANVIDQCADKIISANKVVIIGVGASALVAADINHKLIRNGINVHFNSDYHTQLVQASLLSEKDIIIVISARGNTKEVIRALESGKESGAFIIALTRFGKDKVAQLSDLVIPYYYNEEHAELGMVTPQILQMISFDVLYFKIISLRGNKPLLKAINTINLTQN